MKSTSDMFSFFTRAQHERKAQEKLDKIVEVDDALKFCHRLQTQAAYLRDQLLSAGVSPYMVWLLFYRYLCGFNREQIRKFIIDKLKVRNIPENLVQHMFDELNKVEPDQVVITSEFTHLHASLSKDSVKTLEKTLQKDNELKSHAIGLRKRCLRGEVSISPAGGNQHALAAHHILWHTSFGVFSEHCSEAMPSSRTLDQEAFALVKSEKLSAQPPLDSTVNPYPWNTETIKKYKHQSTPEEKTIIDYYAETALFIIIDALIKDDFFQREIENIVIKETLRSGTQEDEYTKIAIALKKLGYEEDEINAIIYAAFNLRNDSLYRLTQCHAVIDSLYVNASIYLYLNNFFPLMDVFSNPHLMPYFLALFITSAAVSVFAALIAHTGLGTKHDSYVFLKKYHTRLRGMISGQKNAHHGVFVMCKVILPGLTHGMTHISMFTPYTIGIALALGVIYAAVIVAHDHMRESCMEITHRQISIRAKLDACGDLAAINEDPTLNKELYFRKKPGRLYRAAFISTALVHGFLDGLYVFDCGRFDINLGVNLIKAAVAIALVTSVSIGTFGLPIAILAGVAATAAIGWAIVCARRRYKEAKQVLAERDDSTKKLNRKIAEKILDDYQADLQDYPENGKTKLFDHVKSKLCKNSLTDKEIENIIEDVFRRRKLESGDTAQAVQRMFENENVKSVANKIIKTGQPLSANDIKKLRKLVIKVNTTSGQKRPSHLSDILIDTALVIYLSNQTERGVTFSSSLRKKHWFQEAQDVVSQQAIRDGINAIKNPATAVEAPVEIAKEMKHVSSSSHTGHEYTVAGAGGGIVAGAANSLVQYGIYKREGEIRQRVAEQYRSGDKYHKHERKLKKVASQRELKQLELMSLPTGARPCSLTG